MAIINPSGLQYPGSGSTSGGTNASAGADPASATAWLQQQPWYRQTLASWGNPQTLSLGQRGYLARTAIKAGLNPNYGIDTNGSVEDWSTPTGAKIALAAFAAAAGASGFGGGGGAASGSGSTGLAGDEAATGGFAPLSAPSVGSNSGSILGTAGKLLGGDPHDPRTYLDVAGKIGNALGAASQGAAQGRILQTELNQRQDQLGLDRYRTQITAPQQIAANSVKGDILANARDFAYGAPTMVGNIPVPTSSGGLRPSIFSDNTRKLGANMSADALKTPPPPDLTPMDTAGAGSDILNTAGVIGSFADLFDPKLNRSLIPYKRPTFGVVT